MRLPSRWDIDSGTNQAREQTFGSALFFVCMKRWETQPEEEENGCRNRSDVGRPEERTRCIGAASRRSQTRKQGGGKGPLRVSQSPKSAKVRSRREKGKRTPQQAEKGRKRPFRSKRELKLVDLVVERESMVGSQTVFANGQPMLPRRVALVLKPAVLRILLGQTAHILVAVGLGKYRAAAMSAYLPSPLTIQR